MNYGHGYHENVEYINSSYSNEDFQTYLTVLDQTIPQDIPFSYTSPVFVDPVMLYSADSIESTTPRRGRPPRTSYSQAPLTSIPNLRSFTNAQSRTATVLSTPYHIPSRHTKKRVTTSLLTPPTLTASRTQPIIAATTQTVRGPISASGSPLGPEAKNSPQPGTQLLRPTGQLSLHIANPSNCQHPKHLIYNPYDLEPSKPRRGRPPRGASAGLPVTIVVPRRLREVLGLGAGTRICNTCKRRTDIDEEYISDPRYKGPE